MKRISPIVVYLFIVTLVSTMDISSSERHTQQSGIRGNVVAGVKKLQIETRNAGERIVEVDMNVRVKARSRDLLVSVKLSNREDVDLVMVPTFFSLEVTPLMRTWYPEVIRDFVMELIADSMPPAEGYLQHATSLLSLNTQPLQMILIPRSRKVRISYQIPYQKGSQRKQLQRLSIYRGVFNVPLYLADDTKLSEIIQQCLLPRSTHGEYVALYRNGVAVIADKSVNKRLLRQNEAFRLSSSSETTPRLALKNVFIDSIIR